MDRPERDTVGEMELNRTWKPALSLAVPDKVLLYRTGDAISTSTSICISYATVIDTVIAIGRVGPRRGGVVQVDGEGAAGGRLKGDFAEGRGERGEELLGELLDLAE